MSYTGSKAQSGRGTIFSIGSTPTVVGEVRKSSIGGNSWGTEDVTNFQSGPDEEFITTVRNNGEVSLEYNRVVSDAGQVLLEAAYQSGALAPFVLQLPKTAAQTTTGDEYTFNALVQSRELPVETNKAIMGSVKLKISGAVTFTAGT